MIGHNDTNSTVNKVAIFTIKHCIHHITSTDITNDIRNIYTMSRAVAVLLYDNKLVIDSYRKENSTYVSDAVVSAYAIGVKEKLFQQNASCGCAWQLKATTPAPRDCCATTQRRILNIHGYRIHDLFINQDLFNRFMDYVKNNEDNSYIKNLISMLDNGVGSIENLAQPRTAQSENTQVKEIQTNKTNMQNTYFFAPLSPIITQQDSAQKNENTNVLQVRSNKPKTMHSVYSRLISYTLPGKEKENQT